MHENYLNNLEIQPIAVNNRKCKFVGNMTCILTLLNGVVLANGGVDLDPPEGLNPNIPEEPIAKPKRKTGKRTKKTEETPKIEGV